MNLKNVKIFVIFTGFIITPYVYFFVFRPKLLIAEKEFDQRITDIDDKTAFEMKRKLINNKYQPVVLSVIEDKDNKNNKRI